MSYYKVCLCFTCLYVCTCFRAHMFLSRTNGVSNSQVHNIRWQSPLLLHHYKTVGDKNPFFMNLSDKRVLLRLESLSCTVGSCIFNKEKHTGQNAMDWKCRYKGVWPGVLPFSLFTQSFLHSPTQEPVMNHEKNWNGGSKDEHEGQNRGEGGGDACTQHLYSVSTWKKIINSKQQSILPC